MNFWFLILNVILYLSVISCLIWSKVDTKIKAFFIIATLFVTILDSRMLDYAKGFPSDGNNLPRKFLLNNTLIRDPNEKLKDDGAIFFVVIQELSGVNVPKIYQLPWSEQAAKQTQKLQKSIDKNKAPIFVKKSNNEDAGDSGEKSEDDDDKEESSYGRAKSMLKGLFNFGHRPPPGALSAHGSFVEEDENSYAKRFPKK